MGLKDFFQSRKLKKRKPSIVFNEQGHDLHVQPSITDDALCSLWTKCSGCNELLYVSDLKRNNSICKNCNFHHRLSAKERIELLIEPGTFIPLGQNIFPDDPLGFQDLKPYKDRLKEALNCTESNEAIIIGLGKIKDNLVAIGSMEFQFIGGSMGCVVGERIARLVETAIHRKLPVILISSSGGARMHEGILSLMQMAKTSSVLKRLHEERLLYISILTEPTFGGVTASFAMLGDIIIAEPKARIGFAGRRVIEETIRQKLPKDFQTAEYLLENGHIDLIMHRSKLKNTIYDLLRLHNQGLKNNSHRNGKKDTIEDLKDKLFTAVGINRIKQ